MTAVVASAGAKSPRPPAWLIVATGVLALTILGLAVAETNLKAHYLIDQGEFISIFGLAFIAVASVVLYRSGRLAASLPLVFPWVLYPVITQGDQIIDNLSINPMRVICHVLLAAIFATPVAVVVLAVRALVAPRDGRPKRTAAAAAIIPGVPLLAAGRVRQGSAMLAAALFMLETWLADQYLGTLMIVTIIVMTLGVLIHGSLPEPADDSTRPRVSSQGFALAVALGSVLISAAAFVAYKNAPGAYQGSPTLFMDPSQRDVRYPMDRVQLPSAAPAAPADPAEVVAAFTAYARTLDKLVAGYHILERNYTYDFHNELFLRHTPLLANYRAAGLALVDEARTFKKDADQKAAAARTILKAGDPLGALLDDVQGYLTFMFDRAPALERMSAGFAKTSAGLQHAAHLYEGEAKYLATSIADFEKKYRAVLDAPTLASITADFKSSAHAIDALYANRVVGF